MTYRELLLIFYLFTLAVVAVIDVRTLRAPNRLVLPALGAALVLSVPLGPAAYLEVALGGLAAFLALLAVMVASRGSFGAGDVKVGALAGLAVGLRGVPAMLATAFLLAATCALVLLALRLRGRRDPFAFTRSCGRGWPRYWWAARACWAGDPAPLSGGARHG